MKLWKTGSFLMTAALLASAGVAGATDKNTLPVPETDGSLANKIRHEIIMYANYSIWDDVGIDVNHGNVHLTGAVVVPVRREEIDRLAKQVAGAGQVQDDIRVLPTSFQDDQLRLRIARAIYGDPAMLQLANQPLKPIHILVENGHVTLSGIVDTQLQKDIAGARAGTAGMSFGKIVNNLQVVGPSSKKS